MLFLIWFWLACAVFALALLVCILGQLVRLADHAERIAKALERTNTHGMHVRGYMGEPITFKAPDGPT